MDKRLSFEFVLGTCARFCQKKKEVFGANLQVLIGYAIH